MRAIMHGYISLLICIIHDRMFYSLLVSKCSFQTFYLSNFAQSLRTFTWHKIETYRNIKRRSDVRDESAGANVAAKTTTFLFPKYI